MSDNKYPVNFPPFVHPRRLLPWMPGVVGDREAIRQIRHGSAVHLPSYDGSPLVKVFAGQAELIAVCRRIAGTLFQPKVVLIGV